MQEGLTNSLKHSGAGRTEVTVAYEDDALRLEVRDHGSTNGSRLTDAGHGHRSASASG